MDRILVEISHSEDKVRVGKTISKLISRTEVARRIVLAQDRVQWPALVFAVLYLGRSNGCIIRSNLIKISHFFCRLRYSLALAAHYNNAETNTMLFLSLR
jgi:hypothetical protein